MRDGRHIITLPSGVRIVRYARGTRRSPILGAITTVGLALAALAGITAACVLVWALAIVLGE